VKVLLFCRRGARGENESTHGQSLTVTLPRRRSRCADRI